MGDGEGLSLASSLVICSADAGDGDGDSAKVSGDGVGVFGDAADVAAVGEFDGEALLADAPVPTGMFCRC